ncbi:MAG: hypothetical protein E7042_05635 [Lentisphaerae bacterium]|nr:hypothetical protein [Lentisphaerota bacterium]
MKKITVLITALVAVVSAFAAETVSIPKGNPSTLDWNKVPAMKFHRWMQPGEPPIATQARFMYDDNRLYVRVECSEPNINEARSQLRFGKHDSTCWVNDCVELFVDLLDGTTRAYQFVTDIHNDGAELIWRDPKYVNTITWNGYWNHRITYNDDNFVVSLEIPWKTFGIKEMKDREIAMNLTRRRNIAPWGRFVLAKNTEKNLSLSANFFRFGKLNVVPAAVEGAVAHSTPLTGANDAICTVTAKKAIAGTLEFASEKAGGEKILAKKAVTLQPGKTEKITLSYNETEPGSRAVRVLFRGNDGTVTDVWTNTINYNVPLELANSFPVAVSGRDLNIFSRLYVKPENVNIGMEICDGKAIVARREFKPAAGEFFLALPTSGLKPGKYQLKVTLNTPNGKTDQLIQLLITPAL